MSNLWSLLSIYVAVVIVAFPSLYSKISDTYLDHASFWLTLLAVPMVISFFMLTKPHRIGKYHRALSMLEDYCKMIGRQQ